MRFTYILLRAWPINCTRTRRFDKAPVEVVCVLKALLEDGEMLLADGRRFVSEKSSLFHTALDPLEEAAVAASVQRSSAGDDDAPTFRIHPTFRVIALANRPGYPFLVRV